MTSLQHAGTRVLASCRHTVASSVARHRCLSTSNAPEEQPSSEEPSTPLPAPPSTSLTRRLLQNKQQHASTIAAQTFRSDIPVPNPVTKYATTVEGRPPPKSTLKKRVKHPTFTKKTSTVAAGRSYPPKLSVPAPAAKSAAGAARKKATEIEISGERVLTMLMSAAKKGKAHRIKKGNMADVELYLNRLVDETVKGPSKTTKGASKGASKAMSKGPSRAIAKRMERRGGPVAAVDPSIARPEEWKRDEWPGEDWKDLRHADFNDKLAQVLNSELPKGNKFPPHIKPKVTFMRQVEGLIKPTDEAVLEDTEPQFEMRPVSKLAHGLDRVLFNPGVHWLQDPRSRVYNFTPWLESIPKVQDFAFERIGQFIKSSRDKDLWALAKREGRTFAGSTSSLTGLLSQIYFLISQDKEVDISTLSRHFQNEPNDFTPGQRMAASVKFNYNGGAYAIDSDGPSHEKNVLTWMGTLLEKFLTTTPREFSRLMRSSSDPMPVDNSGIREAYRYAKSKHFVMRSQLDGYDARLPGTGVFDIKTRAAVPIRFDLLNYENNSGYLIRHLQGPMESFEKEYYDLIRSAFLKYSFQARIGNMDGVIVAYHNTARLFGFQYLALEEMEARLYGGPARGERVFQKCVQLLEEVAREVVRIYPEQSILATFETQEGGRGMSVWIEPADWDEEEKGARPIAQLDVRATNYLGEHVVRGSTAVASNDPWTIHWTVAQPSENEEYVRYHFARAKARQFRAYTLPEGVSLRAMPDYWRAFSFGPPPDAADAAAREEGPSEEWFRENVRQPNEGVTMMRELARRGREWSEREEERMRGRKKVVWGAPELGSEYEEFVEGTAAEVEGEGEREEEEGMRRGGALWSLVELMKAPKQERTPEPVQDAKDEREGTAYDELNAVLSEAAEAGKTADDTSRDGTPPRERASEELELPRIRRVRARVHAPNDTVDVRQPSGSGVGDGEEGRDVPDSERAEDERRIATERGDRVLEALYRRFTGARIAPARASADGRADPAQEVTAGESGGDPGSGEPGAPRTKP